MNDAGSCRTKPTDMSTAQINQIIATNNQRTDNHIFGLRMNANKSTTTADTGLICFGKRSTCFHQLISNTAPG